MREKGVMHGFTVSFPLKSGSVFKPFTMLTGNPGEGYLSMEKIKAHKYSTGDRIIKEEKLPGRTWSGRVTFPLKNVEHQVLHVANFFVYR